MDVCLLTNINTGFLCLLCGFTFHPKIHLWFSTFILHLQFDFKQFFIFVYSLYLKFDFNHLPTIKVPVLIYTHTHYYRTWFHNLLPLRLVNVVLHDSSHCYFHSPSDHSEQPSGSSLAWSHSSTASRREWGSSRSWQSWIRRYYRSTSVGPWCTTQTCRMWCHPETVLGTLRMTQGWGRPRTCRTSVRNVSVPFEAACVSEGRTSSPRPGEPPCCTICRSGLVYCTKTWRLPEKYIKNVKV